MGWINWKNLPASRTEPQTRGLPIAPSNTVPLTQPTRAIWTGTGGTLSVILTDDTVAIPLTNVPPGVILALCASQVMLTGTSATGLIGFY